ncbi:hypothetical protein [Desulfovibrio ferrophilus]|uniref:Uncharacterized protein n=1 Tax=Desulfovibrio ferrophilus TaxID=241368 RepID=A0A2Z6AZK2_9BACT|nr:hypothetical protein [Desulfovibrio ferrophilus]BBD08648.1 putative uncharacterized protein At5g12430 [Desulfovibrio ferrophilus]
MLFNRRRDQALKIGTYTQTRKRLKASFELLLEASNRNDAHTGEFDTGICRDCEPLTPERIAAAEERKARAKAEELATGQCTPQK